MPVHPNSIAQLQPGNPNGGRPSRKGLARLLDRALGENAEEAVAFAVKVMRGEVQRIKKKPGVGEVAEIPTIRESLDAAIWLAEMRNGKAPSGVAVEVSGTVEHDHRVNAVDLSRLSNEQLEAAEKILNAAGVVDAEFTVAPALIATTVPDEPEDP